MTQLIAEGGHEVIAFADGREALARIAEDGDVRALITSTQPLNMTGIELCAAARKLSGARRALHVILMSSTDDYYLAITALDNGAITFGLLPEPRRRGVAGPPHLDQVVTAGKVDPVARVPDFAAEHWIFVEGRRHRCRARGSTDQVAMELGTGQRVLEDVGVDER